jgi:hypothetical protein
MNGACVTCAKYDTCFYSSEKVLACIRHEPKSETNYEKLFGTPERAAETLGHMCQFTHGGEMCERCRLYLFNDCDMELRAMSDTTIKKQLLEWLRGKAVS